jgi:alcohol dehydrogenase
MQNHLDQSGLTLKLNELNIPRLNSTTCQGCHASNRLLQNNPREMTEQDALQIYQAIYA